MEKDKTLSEQFKEHGDVDKFVSLLTSAKEINGSEAYYSNQAYITEHIASGESVGLWSVGGKETYLMAQEYAATLLNVLDIPVKSSRMQYPTDDFVEARAGHIILEMTKERSPPVYMIEKNLVLDAIDPLRARAADMQILLEQIQSFMDKHGLSPLEMKDIIDTIDSQAPATGNDLD